MSIWNQANAQLRDLVAYEPGKPIEDVARELGLNPSAVIKLASNENPLGPSPKAIEAMRAALLRANIYPDGGGYYLREAIASRYGLARANIILGNGSSEVIEFVGHAFLKPGDEIVTSRHAFVIYKVMAQLFGATTKEVADVNFTHDLDAMGGAIGPSTRLVFVANPNNPTGTAVSQSDIDRLVERTPTNVLIVFDEAYQEFLDEPTDTLKFVRQGRENVLVVRTFSKIQGLASLRIGYGMGAPGLIEVLQKTREPFNTNGIAQAGALAGLLDEEHQRATRELTRRGCEYLQQAFSEMGLEYVPSHTNFVLVKVGDGKAIFQKLLHKGVIVRDMHAYGLPEWIRVTIGTMPQNERFVSELQAAV